MSNSTTDLAYIIDIYMNATEEQKKKIKELSTALVSKPTPPVSNETYDENFKDAIKKTNDIMEKKRTEPLPLVQAKNGTYYPPPLPKKLEEPLRQVVVQSYNPKCHMHKFRDAVKKCEECNKHCCISCINTTYSSCNGRRGKEVCSPCHSNFKNKESNACICSFVFIFIIITVVIIYYTQNQ